MKQMIIILNKYKGNIPGRLLMAKVIKLKCILIRITDILQMKKQPGKSLKLKWTHTITACRHHKIVV